MTFEGILGLCNGNSTTLFRFFVTEIPCQLSELAKVKYQNKVNCTVWHYIFNNKVESSEL